MARGGNVSAVVDELITEARRSGARHPASIRSVVGTIDLPEDDPDLHGADAYVRALFDRSSRRPVLVKEKRARSSARPRRRG